MSYNTRPLANNAVEYVKDDGLSAWKAMPVSQMEAGTGITTGSGTVYRSSSIIDLTGLRSTAGGDIIGVNGTALVCHFGIIPEGTYLTGRVTCLEAPAGGDPDINIYMAVEGTGVEDAPISGLVETLLVNTGDHTLGSVNVFTGMPVAGQYFYLVAGATTDADYTAGKLLVEMESYE